MKKWIFLLFIFWILLFSVALLCAEDNKYLDRVSKTRANFCLNKQSRKIKFTNYAS